MSAIAARLAQAVETLGRRRRGLAGAALLGVGVLLAVLYARPWSTTTYDLHDSGIWVANTETGQVGRLNAQIPEIDFARPSNPAELVQDGRAAYLVEAGEDTTTVRSLDPADPGAEPAELALEGGAQVAAGGGTVAALAGGEVTIIGSDGSLGGGRAVLDAGDDALLAVGVDGTVAAWSPSDGTVGVLAPGADEPRTVELEVPEGVDAGDLSFALVGSRPVGLDRSGDAPRLLLPGEGDVPLAEHGDRAALQRSGPDSGQVLVATDGALLAVGLGDGEVEVLDDGVGGEPMRPAVDDDGCRYGAWRGAGGSLVVRCDDDVVREDGIDVSDAAVLRTGGPQVVLNDPATGVVLLVVDGAVERVDTWPIEEDIPTEADTYEEKLPNPEENIAPEAVADVGGYDEQGVGARPGRVTYLPLLRNDIDENGDILAIDIELEAGEYDDIVSVAHDGRSVAIDLTAWPADESGTVTFRYVATDGALKSKPAEVEVEIVTDPEGHDPSVIEAHELDLQVVSSQRVEQDVMSVFWDYDGDPLYLASASTAARGGHRVTWETEGRVAFTGGEPGVASVALAVRDVTGRAAPPTDLQVTVETADAGTLALDLNNDIVAGQAGQAMAIDPLANDVDPAGGGLTLAGPPDVLRGSADGIGPIEVVDGEVRFEPREPGDYVLLYWVAEADKEEARATVLVRVTTDVQLPPDVRPDVVVVEEGQWAETDLLANDVDPNGDLLAVSDLVVDDITTEDEVPLDALATLLSASVLSDYRTLRADMLPEARPDTYITYDYTATDGLAASRATVTVVVVPAAPNRPPETTASSVLVRAGDAVTVPLSAFASDPDGDPLEVAVVGQPEVGDAAPSGDAVRVFAPADSGDRQVSVIVEVTEPAGNAQSATIDVSIVGPDRDTAPRAEDIEARVRAGGTIVVPVPLAGLDPDGDDVRLLGRTDAIGFDGEIVEDHANQAFQVRTDATTPAGQTELAYQVVDATGRTSPEARLRLVVTPRAKENRAPVAMIDRLTARPSDEIFVDPSANDTDLDGDDVSLSPVLGREGAEDLEPVLVETGDCEAEATESGLVRIATAEEDCTITYAAVDVEEGTGDPLSLPQEGQIVVAAAGEGFAGIRPRALDDYGLPEPRADAVEVDVLRNDEDRDGDPAALEVTLVDADGAAVDRLEGVTLDRATGSMTVALGEKPRLLRYRITDGDRLSADAAVRVPERAANLPPELRDDVGPIEVDADDPEGVIVDLGRYVIDPDGDSGAISYLDVAGSPELDSAKLRARMDDSEIVVDAPDRNTSGPATVQVLAEDAAGGRASLAIPVQITAGDNQPPSWAGDPCGEVARGAPALRVPLRADDPDPGDTERLQFGLDGPDAKDGVSVTIDDGYLLVEATSEAPPNRAVEFTLTVDDGDEGEPVPQPCTISVKRSNLPPLRANPTSVKVEQGKTVPIELRDLVANAEGELTVESRELEPTAAGNVNIAGSSLRFTAGADAKGPATIRYEVSDEFDADGERRRATGLVQLQIVGRPEPPTGAAAEQSSDEAVTVSWAAGDSNGAPIEHFVVTGQPGGSKQCDRSPCTLGPDDGVEVDGSDYSFVVEAVNEVGTSEPSGASGSVTVDRPPSAPGSPVVEALGPGQGALRRVELSWSPGDRRGSPVKEWRLGGDLGGDPIPADQTSVIREVAGDGVALLVTAVNERGDSEPLRIEVGGSYGTPQIPDLVVEPIDGAEPRAKVSWQADGNGRPIQSATVTADGCTVVEEAELTATIGCRSRESRTVTLTVVNTEGVSATRDTPSGDLLARPVVTGVGLTAGDRSIAVDVAFDDGGGVRSGTFTLTSDGDPEVTASGTLDADGRGSVSDLEPWREYTATAVSLCRGEICSEGAVPNHAGATPFAAPDAPVIDDASRVVNDLGVPTGEIDVDFTWDAAGSPLTHTYAITLSTGGSGSGSASSGQTTDARASGNVLTQLGPVTVTVEIVDSAGRTSPPAEVTIEALADVCRLLPVAPGCEQEPPRSGTAPPPSVPPPPSAPPPPPTGPIPPIAITRPTTATTTTTTTTTTPPRETDGP